MLIIGIIGGLVLGGIAGIGLICLGEPKVNDIKFTSYAEGLKITEEMLSTN